MEPKILYHIHKSLPMDTNLHEKNPVHKIQETDSELNGYQWLH
jgi:hypothetical protein